MFVAVVELKADVPKKAFMDDSAGIRCHLETPDFQ